MKDIRRKVRRAQTIVPFGVGGIIDLRGESFVGADIRSWAANGERVESPRLAMKLGVEGFRSAPVIPSGKAAYTTRIGPTYVRFPKWLFCPQCRGMQYWRQDLEQRDKPPTCRRCPAKAHLAPMRFIQVCRAGHMSDIDWHWWAHSKHEGHAQRQCQVVDRLRFVATPESSGLEALRVVCLVCRAERSLAGLSQKDILKQSRVKCRGTHPWQYGTDEAVSCEEVPQAVQRGASNVYFPITHSALDIPAPSGLPEDDELTQKVINNALWPDFVSSDSSPAADAYKKVIAIQCGVSEEFVENLRNHHVSRARSSVKAVDPDEDLSIAEWAAFSAPESVAESQTFSVRRTDLGIRPGDPGSMRILAAAISAVVVADRVREVRALEGFSRYEPSAGDEEDRGGIVVSVNTASRARWLPAIETYGEGIFIAVDEKRLSAWERLEPVRGWTRRIERNLDASFQADRLRSKSGPELLPRFVMLHTLAHHFIRQLSYDSGYNAAALRERVYARSHPTASKLPPQSGVFIYTAAGDAEGTLGGLVRQGQPPNLSETLIRLLESAQWCSQDPLCADSTGRSLANLNRAACHACTLLPETCCEIGNTLLDRILLIGNGEVPGFFQEVVQAALEESAEAVDRQ
ncbi:hypothetical protein SAMN04244553_5434 [Nocardia amikacinitolerans]|uniref:MrfA-like Zn-binding domain-containing protein n=1 Tax=Nocardia amikacinitolerans TaxID=756689 RepID=A0A285LU59_9NOCA|nr:DUF1998 domain-containing protein [Nocardia amikacinitolerans]SNY88460.1 hypothetical protein SAMN04244553_5434 [Nocardia amikacinitolerans]